MKSLVLTFVLLFVVSVFAEDAAPLSALKAADQARVEAVLSGDKEKLGAILSDDLRYAHSSGVVDTKQSFIDAIAAGKLKYTAIEYQEQNFTLAAPSVALMNGRAHVKVGNLDVVMSFLSVWRLEDGHWRFLAWQSCKLPTETK